MALPPWPQDLIPELSIRAAARPVIVLDDDPTGTQTLRDVTVFTAWNADAIAPRLDEPVLFLSTNSRALDEASAVTVTRAAARAAIRAGRIGGRPITIVSRSDSTLRGHYPSEPEAVAVAIGASDARYLLAPFFGEGGRLTVDDVHYLQQGDQRRPVGETEFARDPTFGYRASNLRDWVAERCAAAGRAMPPVTSLSIERLRRDGPAGAAETLLGMPPGGVAIANAEVDRDIEVVALGAAMAEEAGLPLVARTAASYVRARAGRPRAPLLARGELETDGPGLIVVGSHVEMTTRQFEALLNSPRRPRLDTHELAIAPILAGGDSAERAVADATAAMERALAAGRIGVVSTERTRRDIGLAGGRAVSDGLVAVVAGIQRRPGWVIAKGGITSSDVASRGLRMAEARVAGQVVRGVPVWIGSEGSRWPGLALVVFPGNVGDETALLRVVAILAAP